MSTIAIVGMACEYADARTPSQLWQNVLAQRRAFRRIPDCRLRASDYLSSDPDEPDRTYANKAAVIEGYEFDRVRFRVVGSTFRQVDLAHWLALDVAARALADAGFPDGTGLPRPTTGVIVGNTLTGEFSRAGSLRLRWPYVRRVVSASLMAEGWPLEQRQTLLERVRRAYQEPFPAVGEETLAGALSNTIAGRICNHFHLQGGGFTVDGACASSLLAVTTACGALVAGDLDVAVVGGVDLSLDPFELVGFARVGALASSTMRVYDARSDGFWPGEGCGFVVLTRAEDANARGLRTYATIRGWGISSDGTGGLTRPEVDGQLLALRRAYARAGCGADSVAYFEGHGTGTSVGDAVELRALNLVRQEAGAQTPAAVGSVKAIIGHTKAAAGVASLIKAALALDAEIIPATAGCDEPHPELRGPKPLLRTPREPEIWPSTAPARAAVSAMGFGGINTHVVLERSGNRARPHVSSDQRRIAASAQDAELFCFAASTFDELEQAVSRVATYASQLSFCDLSDLAASLAQDIPPGVVRAGVVAATPDELADRLGRLRAWVAEESPTPRVDVSSGMFVGTGLQPRIGFLFPGQGAPAHIDGGLWRRRFQDVQALYERAALPHMADTIRTDVAQPAILTASLAGLHVLNRLGIDADHALGHSLGELAALHWAGVWDEQSLLRIGAARGAAMASVVGPHGAMVSIGMPATAVASLLNGSGVVIAGFNSPHQTVISGEAEPIEGIVALAQQRGWQTVRLPVSHAFHSELMRSAEHVFAATLDAERSVPPTRRVISTVTGRPVEVGINLRDHLCAQMSSPVLFERAIACMSADVDLLLEVGPGSTLSGLSAQCLATPVVALDACGESLRGLLNALGAAYALGAAVDVQALFNDRFTRPFHLDWQPRFFANPCESAPTDDDQGDSSTVSVRRVDVETYQPPVASISGSILEEVRQLVAERTELPRSAVADDARLLADLHLNSIVVGQLVAAAARRVGLPVPTAPTEFATATVVGLARALEELAATRGEGPARRDEAANLPPGVDAWVRPFVVQDIEMALEREASPLAPGGWHVLVSGAHPLASALVQSFADCPGHGVVVCLSPELNTADVQRLLDAVNEVQATRSARFVLVSTGSWGAAIARTLHLEVPSVTTCVVEVSTDAAAEAAAEWVRVEAVAAFGYVEAHYTRSGVRSVPLLRTAAQGRKERAPQLGPDDVLLVSGGGKGIAAECALALARQTGVKLLLLGRSSPHSDPQLAENLRRLEAHGVQFRYTPADITDGLAVERAVREAEAVLGRVTAVVHGAGSNTPRLLSDLAIEHVEHTLAPKVAGLQNILRALEPGSLRLLVGFGSIIARVGLRGEGDYALANEALAKMVREFQDAHPECLCLTLEWSIWSGIGMGERLGRVEALARDGVSAIPPDQGVAALLQLIAEPPPCASVVVAGRMPAVPTLRLDTPELPLLRFLERPRAYFPGIELVADVDLTPDTDPYLRDHRLHGECVFPAVMGLEAMAQIALALIPGAGPPNVIQGVDFLRPIVVPSSGERTIRLAGLVRDPSTVDVVIRSDETDFQVDHFRATCRWQPESSICCVDGLQPGSSCADQNVQLDPEHDLYGGLFFQDGRFRRVQEYRSLGARQCVARIAPATNAAWFATYLPARLILGDPGIRDASLHAVQACIPHATVLPIGVDRITLAEFDGGLSATAEATEQLEDGPRLTYHLHIQPASAQPPEIWEGLRLQRVEERDVHTEWLPSLLGPYVERRVADLVSNASVRVTITEQSPLSAPANGRAAPILHRADGKPDSFDRRALSASHAGRLLLTVDGPPPIGCDLEPIHARSEEVWADLLGSQRLQLARTIAEEIQQPLDVAATLVWTALESLKKAGLALDCPVVLHRTTSDNWQVLQAGTHKLATHIARLRHYDLPFAIAVLVGESNDPL